MHAEGYIPNIIICHLTELTALSEYIHIQVTTSSHYVLKYDRKNCCLSNDWATFWTFFISIKCKFVYENLID